MVSAVNIAIQACTSLFIVAPPSSLFYLLIQKDGIKDNKKTAFVEFHFCTACTKRRFVGCSSIQVTIVRVFCSTAAVISLQSVSAIGLMTVT